MKIIYECEYCKEQFNDASTCMAHEILHMCSNDKAKYYIQNVLGKDLCSYCEHAYYVYGCELSCNHNDCNQNNNYQYFKRSQDHDF